MVLPAGNYTLSFEAFGCNATNSAEPGTLPSAGDVVAFLTGKDNVDITNTAAAGDATFHNVSFTFDVTTANTAYAFGIKKLADGSKIDWCQIKNVKLTLNSTDIFAVVNNSVDPFVYSGSQTWHTNTWSTEGQRDGSRFQVPFHELWVANGGKLADATIKGTYTPAESGVYKVSAWVRAVNESGGAISGAQIFVGDTKADACSGSPVMSNKGRLGTFTAMADGVSGTPFEYGFELKDAQINWLAFKNVTITFLGDLPQSEIDALLSQVPTGKMNASVKSTLDGYVSALNTEKSVASYNTLSLYLPTAQASANVYADINGAISAYATKATSLDAAGQAAYDASGVTTKYNNGTYGTLAEAEAELQAALAVATKAQTTEGSDWTGLITNPSFETGNFSGWTNSGLEVQDNDSFEKVGSYYAEAWQPNGTKSVKQTISAMPAGVYRLSAKSKARGVTSAKIFANGIDKAITIANETATYSVEFACDDNANVELGFEGVGTGAGSSWLCVDNFTLSLVSAGLPDVTPVVGKMNATVAAAQTTAIETYEANRTVANYNAASAAVAAAQASVDAYAAANVAIVKAEGIIAETNVFVAANKTAYQDAINTAKSAYNEGSMEDATATSLENNLNGGTAYKHEGDPMRPFYSGAWSATNEVSIYTNNWSAEGNTDGSNFTTPFIEDWVADANSLANTTISASVTNLPSGTYNVTARVRMRLKNDGEAPVNGLSLQASSGEPVAVSGTPNYGSFYVAEVAATGYVTEEGGSLDINFIVNNTNASWLSIKAVNYERTGDLPAADAADYAALNTAISAVSGNVAGFEAGEYAPYNNKEAFAALATAEAINPSVVNVKPTVQAATAALTGATWTANAEELNAVYDGNFAIQPEHTTGPTALAGWNNPAGIRQLIKNTETYPGLNTASAKAAVFAWGGTTMKYGETDGYTIPLKGHAIYELSFKTCGWADGDMGYVNVDVKNASDEGLQTVSTVVATKRITEENPWDEFKILFVTGEAGNYKLGMWTSKHTTFTDIVLKKAASQTLTFDDGEELPKFAPGTYPSVRVNRTLNTGENVWNTLVLPFDYTNADWAVRELSSSTEDNLSFSVVEGGAMTAGKPYLVRPNAAVTSIEAENVAVIKTPTAVETEKYSFIPVFAPATITGDGTNYFVATGTNKLYCAKANIATNGYRAYFHYTGTKSGARSVFLNFDEVDPTAINIIEATEAESGALKDGKYLINGKIVLVKNGVKYDANGKKLN